MEAPPLSIRRSDPPDGASTEVLWLHGLGSDGGGEKASLLRERMLERGMAFATLDFRGHGASGGRLRDLTCTGLLEDCGRAVDLVPAGRRVVLVGSSMGGWTAAWWAALHPGRAAALVLVAPALRFPEVIVERIGPEAAARWEREGVLALDTGPGPAEFGWGLVEDGRRYRPADLAAALAARPTPILLVHGKRDDSCDWRESAAFAGRVPGVRLVLLEDGDHRLSAHRERLCEEVEGFVAGPRSPS